MPVEVKFCGLTRPEDARVATDLGARYAGVIFAGGPRNLDPARASDVLDGAGPGVDRVGVFGKVSPAEIARIVEEAHLDIVQLHADPSAEIVLEVAEATGARIWAVFRVGGAIADEDIVSLQELWDASDALVLDSNVKGSLGGSGISFNWSGATGLARGRVSPLAVAGGLTAANVAQAIDTLSPDIVDVSSGVESSPGIKDHTRMAEFMDAVGRASVFR
ncbi:MAG: phosphoribosylanthranilate isomerase [Gemmatimonadaceae bacterium]|nr:phosphoribosylanthranilate isomerase [Gemmatimonadaceae bacterium]